MPIQAVAASAVVRTAFDGHHFHLGFIILILLLLGALGYGAIRLRDRSMTTTNLSVRREIIVEPSPCQQRVLPGRHSAERPVRRLTLVCRLLYPIGWRYSPAITC